MTFGFTSCISQTSFLHVLVLCSFMHSIQHLFALILGKCTIVNFFSDWWLVKKVFVHSSFYVHVIAFMKLRH
jgi:hypothetical protein